MGDSEKEKLIATIKNNNGMKPELWTNMMKDAVHRGKKEVMSGLATYLMQRYLIYSVLLYKGYDEKMLLDALTEIPALPGSQEDKDNKSTAAAGG